LTLGLMAAACATTEQKPDGPVIDKLTLEGTKGLSTKELEKRIVTAPTPFYDEWLDREQHFDPNAWAADQRRIERYYQAHGFYQAHVTEDEVKPLPNGHVSLRMKIVEGELTHIAKVDVRGLEALPEGKRDDLLSDLRPKTGKAFLEEDWVEAQALVAKRLQELGYAGATVEAEAAVDVKTHTADLIIETEPGPRYKFGGILVKDPDGKVSQKLIEEHVASAVHAGDWYDPKALTEAQARVFQMGVFSAVKVSRAELDPQADVVPVEVDIREAPFHTLRYGFGIGADQLRDEAHGFIEYQDRNFLGGLRKLTIRAKLGYAVLSTQSGVLAIVSAIDGEPDVQQGPFGNITVALEQPDFGFSWLSLQTSLELSHSIEPAYQATGGTAKVGLVARPTSHLTLGLSLNPSYYRLTAPPDLTTTTTAFYGCSLDCALTYLEQTVTWDHRDNLLEPHRGYYLSLGIQEGGTNRLLPNGSSNYEVLNYIRVTPEARGYYSVLENKITLAARVAFGAIESLTGADSAIPVRFFSGGNDMRGFSARRLAPYAVAPNTDCTKQLAIDNVTNHCPSYGDQLPIGGNTLLEGSLELRFTVLEELTLATFIDAGYVSKGQLSLYFLSELNVAVGIGIRYRTPIGPIRLDVAVRIPGIGAPLEQYQATGIPVQVSRGCFFGLASGSSDHYSGSPEGQCAFHLSVGEAF
jgi:translocation and assembly module TamA